MKTHIINRSAWPGRALRAGWFPVLLILTALLAMSVTQACGLSATNTPSAIPWNQIGAKAGVNYQGDGLAVTPTETGARLHCVFQRLDGEATSEGLWLTSSVTNTVGDRFRVTAVAVVMKGAKATLRTPRSWDDHLTPALSPFDRSALVKRGDGATLPASRQDLVADDSWYLYATFLGEISPGSESGFSLPTAGQVAVCGQTVRFNRPGLTEEYSVSMDGVRQDFIVEQAPLGQPGGELVIELAVAGAQVEPVADGTRLVLDNSGRKIAYSRLRATDATGRELPARIEVASVGDEATSLDAWGVGENQEPSLLTPASVMDELAVVVDDAEAVYPVRIDPTFSDANWVSMGGLPGANGQVNAAVTDSSGNLYIGGEFTLVGNILATNIAQWNGSSWSALGSGLSGVLDFPGVYFDSFVSALAVSGSTLYAGGSFKRAGGIAVNDIAQWNGSSWSTLGSGIPGFNELGPAVLALAVSGSTLYAGGEFSSAGGIAATNIAEWNGSSWSALGSGMNSNVLALAVSGSTLYAGGEFWSAGGIAATNIAQWNGSSWSALGSGSNGLNSPVYALVASGSTLYAGGSFRTRFGGVANCIAQWNGSSWSALGSGMNGDVCALAVSGSTLYAGGNFTTAGGVAAANVAEWNGSIWSSLGSGMGGISPFVSALAASGGTLYAGGSFTTAGASAANFIAGWNGSSWSALGSGMNGDVCALAVSGSTLYAGGAFTWAGGSPANYIAQWNGSGWSGVGLGMSGADAYNGSVDYYGPVVYALAVSGSTLYAGGDFTTAGGIAANDIAQWNGTTWSALDSGISTDPDENGPFVYALAVSGNTLYVGGAFTWAGGESYSAGGIWANNIAQWNGSRWSTLGSGIYSDDSGGATCVSALAVSGSTLYAGGAFAYAGDRAATNIAQWNGSSWSALGSGLNSEVDALAVSGSTLYAGGWFTMAGDDTNANCIAQWNGSSWSSLGPGIGGNNPSVSALEVSGSTLYAGGDFTTAGGSAANCIAQWNGSSWSSLGSGMSGGAEYGPNVYALTVLGGTLYAGGDFSIAGTNVSAYAAMASLPVSIAIITTNAAFGFTNGVFGFDVSGPPGSSVVILDSTDLQNWIPLQTNLLGSGLLYFSDAQSPATVRRFYRAQLLP